MFRFPSALPRLSCLPRLSLSRHGMALGLCLSLFAPPGQAGGPAEFACPDFFAGGKPPVFRSTPGQRLRALCFNAFAVMHNGSTRTPLFAAEKLNRASLRDAADEVRTDRFFADARLPGAERATLDDYRESGYDRGHMAPAADMPNPDAMAQSFSLANMVPQVPEHNRKTWADTEAAVRRYAMRNVSSDVFVITGPVFPAQPQRIGPNGVAVPSHLYKLVYDARTHRAWAYWQENARGTRMTAPISYDELVRRTGITFLPGVTVLAGGDTTADPVTPPPAPVIRQVDNPDQTAANDENACLTGPRGGHYRIVNGKKRYGCTPTQ